MSRELRMVPPGWEHPKEYNQWRGIEDKALLAGPYSKYLAEWEEEVQHWVKGEYYTYRYDKDTNVFWKEWRPRTDEDELEEMPKPEDYMPEWAPGEATYYMMYQTVSEGSPISPSFATPEELATWLSIHQARDGTYDNWLGVIKQGFTVGSAYIDTTTGRVESTVKLESGARDG